MLDLFFIIVLKLGVAGAALATDLSQGISATLCLFYIYKKEKVLWPEHHDWRITAGVYLVVIRKVRKELAAS